MSARLILSNIQPPSSTLPDCAIRDSVKTHSALGGTESTTFHNWFGEAPLLQSSTTDTGAQSQTTDAKTSSQWTAPVSLPDDRELPLSLFDDAALSTTTNGDWARRKP